MAGMGLTLAGWPRLEAGEEPAPPKARSVIELWMAGGPPQTDTFDPKPEAGEDYCGPWKNPVQTNVPGIKIGEMLPLLAKQADKYSIIRSFTHNNDGHETAAYIVLTGTLPTPEVAYPAIGAVVGMKKSTKPATRAACRPTSCSLLPWAGSRPKVSWAPGIGPL